MIAYPGEQFPDQEDKGEGGENLSAGVARAQLQLGAASYDDLAAAITDRLEHDRQISKQLSKEVATAEQRLYEKQAHLQELEQRIFAIGNGMEDLIDLNVGGQPMSTLRSVLCSAEGSLLAGMFSGNFDDVHKRDKEGRIFLDVDPTLFAKLLSHLRLRRIASPDRPAPLPVVSEEYSAEYEMLVKYFGLEAFMYGDIGPSCNIFERIAEMRDVCQGKLQSKDLIRIQLSSTGGVPSANHEEVFGSSGFRERSLENSYGTQTNTICVKFLKHRVRVEGMEMRAKVADVMGHMSNNWIFRHGEAKVEMSYAFSRNTPCTGRLDVHGVGHAFVDEVVWVFTRDFCLEHIVLYGRVMSK